MNKAVAQAVVARANGQCELCYHTDLPLHLHHLKFRSQGGADTAENLKHICVVCHDAAHGIFRLMNGHSCNTCALAVSCKLSMAKTVVKEKEQTPSDFISGLFGNS